MPTRESIRGKLESARQELLDWYRALPQDDLTRPCTESEVEGGAPWSAKDHIAHLAMIERNFQQICRRTLAGDERPVGFGGGGDRESMIANVHKMNQSNVEEHRQEELDALVADLDAARRDTLELLEGLTDEQLQVKVPGAPWADGTVGGVLITNGYHEQMHRTWVEEGLAGGTPA